MFVDKNIEPLCYIHYEHKGIFGIGFDFHVFTVTLPKRIAFLYLVLSQYLHW